MDLVMDHQADPVDILTQMDLEDTIRELEHYEVCEYIDVLVADQEINAGGGDDDNNRSISTTNVPLARVVHPQTESKANLLNKHLTDMQSFKQASHALLQEVYLSCCAATWAPVDLVCQR